jgi:anti-repressor protein
MSPTPKKQPMVRCPHCGAMNDPNRGSTRCFSCNLPLSQAVAPFTFPDTGADVRTAMIDGEPWFVAADVCAALAIGNHSQATSYLDDDERGVISSETPGGVQSISVVNEPGLYSLILRSRKPEAKAFKRWITHDVLPAIRKTGTYAVEQVRALPQTFGEALRAYADEVDAHDATKQRAAALEAPAAAWDRLAEATGDYSVREAAQILDRDPLINTGQNRLFKTMHDVGWIDSRGEPYQAQVETGRLVRRTASYDNPKTGEPVLYSQIRVTAKGLAKLRDVLGGGPDNQLDIGGA